MRTSNRSTTDSPLRKGDGELSNDKNNSRVGSSDSTLRGPMTANAGVTMRDLAAEHAVRVARQDFANVRAGLPEPPTVFPQGGVNPTPPRPPNGRAEPEYEQLGRLGLTSSFEPAAPRERPTR